jgi:penicillin-binding protein 1A
LAFLAVALVASVAVGAVVYSVVFSDLPEIYSLHDYRPNLITRVRAADGTVIGEISMERRVVVPIERVPEYLVQAFIAAEDDAFYEHEGLDYPSIMRAAWTNLKAGGVRQGGSTITQQVAKTFLLSSDRTFVRKLKDMVLAREIEQHLQKNEILYLYLNQIYLGSGAYGVEAAAQRYFDRPVEELTLAQAAVIAGVVPAPSRYSPRVSMELSRKRQEFVLRRMLAQGFITQDDHDTALAEEIVLARPEPSDTPSAVAYFHEEVRRYLVARYGENEVKTGGLDVVTTLDLAAQLDAHRALRLGLRNHDRRRGYRGASRQVPEEEWPLALEELTEAREGRDEYLGLVVEGLVTEVDDAAGSARVALGGDVETSLPFEAVKWARKPDPDWDGAITRLTKVSQALQPGDLIRLERTGEITPESAEVELPAGEDGDQPLPVPTYALFQEPQAEGALFSMEVATGRVQALSGGFSFFRSQFDRATQMRRQPGSAFKPIVYATALRVGYTPATIVYDTPIVYRDASTGFTWKPGNYSDKFYGPITLRHALAKSRNVATVKVLRDIGIPPVIRMARALGIERDLEPNLSLGLGSSEVTLAELVRAYATFASGGRRVEPIFILEIRDRDGELLEENVRLFDALELAVREGEELEPPNLSDDEVRERILEQLRQEVDRGDDPNSPPPGYGLDPVTAFLMTDMLQAVVRDGTGWRAKALDRPTAGKTGTTNDLKDAWYIGFSPKVVAGVWVGYDTAANLGKNETGSRAASPIWVDYASRVMGRNRRIEFKVPDTGVVFARIDAATGKIACAGDEKAIFQPFREGTVPSERAPCFPSGGSASGNGSGLRPRMD